MTSVVALPLVLLLALSGCNTANIPESEYAAATTTNNVNVNERTSGSEGFTAVNPRINEYSIINSAGAEYTTGSSFESTTSSFPSESMKETSYAVKSSSGYNAALPETTPLTTVSVNPTGTTIGTYKVTALKEDIKNVTFTKEPQVVYSSIKETLMTEASTAWPPVASTTKNAQSVATTVVTATPTSKVTTSSMKTTSGNTVTTTAAPKKSNAPSTSISVLVTLMPAVLSYVLNNN